MLRVLSSLTRLRMPLPALDTMARSTYLPQFLSRQASSGPPSSDEAESHIKVSFKEVLKAYGTDWAFALTLWVVLHFLSKQVGHTREFSLSQDISIQHTFAVQSVRSSRCRLNDDQADVDDLPPRSERVPVRLAPSLDLVLDLTGSFISLRCFSSSRSSCPWPRSSSSRPASCAPAGTPTTPPSAS